MAGVGQVELAAVFIGQMGAGQMADPLAEGNQAIQAAYREAEEIGRCRRGAELLAQRFQGRIMAAHGNHGRFLGKLGGDGRLDQVGFGRRPVILVHRTAHDFAPVQQEQASLL